MSNKIIIILSIFVYFIILAGLRSASLSEWNTLWAMLATFVAGSIVVAHNIRNGNTPLSNPIKNRRNRKAAEKRMREYLVEHGLVPYTWTIQEIHGKETTDGRWDFYVEVEYTIAIEDSTGGFSKPGWGVHLKWIDVDKLFLNPYNQRFSTRHHLASMQLRLNERELELAECRGLTVEEMRRQYGREQRLSELGI